MSFRAELRFQSGDFVFITLALNFLAARLVLELRQSGAHAIDLPRAVWPDDDFLSGGLIGWGLVAGVAIFTGMVPSGPITACAIIVGTVIIVTIAGTPIAVGTIRIIVVFTLMIASTVRVRSADLLN